MRAPELNRMTAGAAVRQLAHPHEERPRVLEPLLARTGDVGSGAVTCGSTEKRSQVVDLAVGPNGCAALQPRRGPSDRVPDGEHDDCCGPAQARGRGPISNPTIPRGMGSLREGGFERTTAGHQY